MSEFNHAPSGRQLETEINALFTRMYRAYPAATGRQFIRLIPDGKDPPESPRAVQDKINAMLRAINTSSGVTVPFVELDERENLKAGWEFADFKAVREAVSAVDTASTPVITTAGTATVAENATLAVALAATDNTAVTWSIVGGADANRFDIVGTTLRWAGNVTRDFEAPVDANGNNVYEVIVQAKDAADLTAQKQINVTVTDVGAA